LVGNRAVGHRLVHRGDIGLWRPDDQAEDRRIHRASEAFVGPARLDLARLGPRYLRLQRRDEPVHAHEGKDESEATDGDQRGQRDVMILCDLIDESSDEDEARCKDQAKMPAPNLAVGGFDQPRP
jgi:hypothetical protein